MSSLSWSTKNHLSNYSIAPSRAGIYLIGLEDKSIPIPEVNDNYLGANFPAQFDPKYVGISSCSIRTRLSAHYRKKGNKPIAEFIGDKKLEQINLHYVFCETVNTQMEHLFLISTLNLFQWNVRKSEKTALIKQYVQIYEKEVSDFDRERYDWYREIEFESGTITKGSSQKLTWD